MNQLQAPSRDIVLKTVVTHTVTYFVVGALAFVLLGYHGLYADTSLKLMMRQTTERIVMAGPLFQPIRGLLFGVVFALLRDPFFGSRNGWVLMWTVLVSVGIVGTFGPSLGSLEGMIYTVFPLRLHVIGLPEVLLQSFLLSWIVFHWVNSPRARWLGRVMVALFVGVLLMSTLGLLVGAAPRP